MNITSKILTALLAYIKARGHSGDCPVSRFVLPTICECGYETLRTAIINITRTKKD